MDPERWKKISALYHQARGLDEAAREQCLVEACGADIELRREVEALLGVPDKAASGIDRVIETAAAEYADHLSEGERIGPYLLLGVIARGGMGQVFLAERADQEFERQVAIKTLGWMGATPDLIERFRQERQILADLDHPNIARLLDGGETVNGVPYLVMEYVDGQPIDQYCDTRQLSVQDRLQLYQKICNAVDYAHRKLIVHRDIKPSNILVTEDGEPKLLDFGIAKLLDDGAAQNPVAVTREGAGMMTPEYASPEQVRAEPVSTATDVYSLGVLLYKILCGRMPYTPKAMSTDLARAIQTEIPSRPSDALGLPARVSGNDSIDAISAARKTSAIRLRRRLRGDIDNVVLKALRKEPERRYSSALALSDDIENVLTFRPVTARPASFAYRSTRFLRRYRAGVFISLIVAAILITSVMQVVQQRDKAQVAALQSEQVVKFLGELFYSASTLRTRGEAITADDLLAAGVVDIGSLDDQPQVQARLLEIMGTSYQYIGDIEKLGELMQRALDIRQNQLPHDAAAIGNTLRAFSESARLTGHLGEAERQLRQSVALLIEAYGPEHGSVAYALSRLGEVLRMSGLLVEAVEALQQAAAMKEKLGETGDEDAIDIYGNLAIALNDAGRADEAETINRKAVAASRLLMGDKDPNTLTRIGNLGLIQIRQGNYTEAKKNIGEAYESMNEIWPAESVNTTWIAGSKGSILLYLGQFDESLAAYEEHLQKTLRVYGINSLRHAKALQNLGRWNLVTGNYSDALQLFGQALAMTAIKGEDPGSRAGSIRLQMAMAHIAAGNYEVAEAVALQALSAPDMLGRGTIPGLQRAVARSLSRQGRYNEAMRLFETSLRARESFASTTSVSLLPTLIAMSKHYRRAGDPERALSIARRAHDIGLTVSPPDTWGPALATAEYAAALRALRDSETAQSLFDNAIIDLVAAFGIGNPRIADLRQEFETAIP